MAEGLFQSIGQRLGNDLIDQGDQGLALSLQLLQDGGGTGRRRSAKQTRRAIGDARDIQKRPLTGLVLGQLGAVGQALADLGKDLLAQGAARGARQSRQLRVTG